MKKDLKIQFTMEQWISSDAQKCVNIFLKDIDTSTFEADAFKTKTEEENEDRKVVREFITALKNKKTENRDLINSSGWNNHPFPELVEMPKTKHLHKRIMNEMEKFLHKTMYCQLLFNNNIPCYYKLVWSIKDDYRSQKSVCMSLNIHKGEDTYLEIFQHAIMLCTPSVVQSTFEYLSEQYDAIDKMDSKEEAKKKEDEVRHDFHKSLRQADPFGNGHAESIIHNLLNLSDIPHKAIRAVFKHIKEKTN